MLRQENYLRDNEGASFSRKKNSNDFAIKSTFAEMNAEHIQILGSGGRWIPIFAQLRSFFLLLAPTVAPFHFRKEGNSDATTEGRGKGMLCD